ncbi:MAG: hypothetical protein R3C03_19240 [Pirellulaceae bacterium]
MSTSSSEIAISPIRHIWRGALATCAYECKRGLTWQRISVSLVLAFFPPVMLFFFLLGLNTGNEVDPVAFVKIVIYFLVGLVCLLSILLWTTTNMYSELEGKSWIFVASRPFGRLSLLFGKYLASVVQSSAIAQTGLILATLTANHMGVMADVNKFYFSTAAIFLLASLSYSAVLSLIGVIFTKRAMVFGAVYLIGVEFIVANIPAIIGRFTLRQHLQELGISWNGWFLPDGQDEFDQMFGNYPDWLNLVCIASISIASLVAASFIISSREYLTGDET